MNKEPDLIRLQITSEYIDIIKKEGAKAHVICLNLDSDKTFLSTAESFMDMSSSSIVVKAEHILLRDFVKVYNDYLTTLADPTKISIKAKFILIYLYEIIRGNDLSNIYDLKRLNELTISNQFEKNVDLIRSANYGQPSQEMKDEFMFSSILKKMNSEHFLGMASMINRVASLIVKADGKITPEEEVYLKTLADKINNPKIVVRGVQLNAIPEDDTLEKVLLELNELIGLEGIKKTIDDLTNFLKVQKLREEKGLKSSESTLHAVFMGPPGTGKTTVARLLGRIYKHLGFLNKGHVVETDRAGMVAGYVGQTAIKAEEIIEQAADGVLFIDEAYSLTTGGFNDFGGEAIEILLKRMEDLRGNLVVVVAGYPDEMEIFIQSNPGLQSRFNRYFNFDHYNVDALLKIFKLYATKADFLLTEDAEGKIAEIIERVHEKRHRGFGNARTMRNLFERIIEQQANRVVSITPITKEILETLTEEDVPEVLKAVKDIIVFEEEKEQE
jgi:AAA+ superfamily predicted ATPase